MKKLLFFSVFFLLVLGLLFYINKSGTIIIGGCKYRINETRINLNNANINSDEDWVYKLAKFKNLKYVELKEKDISFDTLIMLKNNYKNTYFEWHILYYGISIYDDTVELNISNQNLNFDELEELISFLPNLRLLNIASTNINGVQIKELLKKYPFINILWNTEICGISVSSDKINEIINLDFSDQKNLKLSDLEVLISLLPNLKMVDLSDTGFSNEELNSLRSKFSNVNIRWKLYLGQWSLMTDDVSFSVLVTKINYNRLTSKDIEVLKYCTNLQALDLGHQAITDISVIGNYLKDLRILILADNKIEDISPLGSLTHLHYLELFVNRISDFSVLKNLKELIDINIGYNTVSNLDDLLHFENIERLWLISGGISEEDRIILRDTYPSALVNTSWSLSSTGNGWRTHERYYAMIDMFNNKRYMSEEFSKYDN